ncbi:hypothetical protein [Bifidobacterium simiiventris]|uniref:hypothetical protein n=1 Tax=Bifidobacterium simiiventris TaxID=2834434 RepID=UPI001C58DEA2|nr:hypothetical protein [Bifidobacterium simiiventris]MBW3078866.1 hypothetical protein [Bifidobacterium simiiventris]
MKPRIRSRKALRGAICMALASLLQLGMVLGAFGRASSQRYTWSWALEMITLVIFLACAVMWLCAAYSETAALAIGEKPPEDERDRSVLTKANAKALQVLEATMLSVAIVVLFVGIGLDNMILAVIGLTVIVCGWVALALQIGLAWWYFRH